MKNDNTWTQRGEHHTLGSVGGDYGKDSGREIGGRITWGEMSGMGDGGVVATNPTLP